MATKCRSAVYTKRFTDWNNVPVTLTMEEVCCLLHCSDATAIKRIREGLIKAVKNGKAWVIDRDSVRDFIQSGKELAR